MKTEIQWKCLHFEDMSPKYLYQVLQLRSAVFVLEQRCIFLDPDSKDLHCYHVMGLLNDELIATTRLLPPGLAYPQASIGRVATNIHYRKTGVGIALMQHSIRYCEQLFTKGPIKIGAHLYLQAFYQKFGFVPSSKVYMEDGIEHIEMLRT